MADLRGRPEQLSDGATIAIIGGGPAGSFAAIHLLSLAQTQGRRIRVVVFERRRHRAPGSDEQPSNDYSGCPKCAGGISPRFNEALERLEIFVPPQVMQARIKSITVQGNWKHIYLPVPETRRMISVYRGALPFGQDLHHYSFDSLLLDCATGRGAELVGGRVIGARFDEHLKPVVQYESDGRESELKADFAIFAGGVNEKAGCRRGTPSVIDLFRMLQPRYEPPALRKALIFELEAPGHMAEMAEGDLHFIESSVDQLHLDMCSILPKRGFFTVSLIGRSVDESQSHRQNMAVIEDFLALPQIRRTLPPVSALRVRCVCNPSIVIGSARWPLVGRAAAVGDMATSRQYKDGMLSAHDMARDLAEVIVKQGVDVDTLAREYGATLARFKRDNRYASLIFVLYRWFFTSPFLSRVIYQTYASERKSRSRRDRSFERIFWAISSGDESYERIAWAMVRPSTLWQIIADGLYVTLRNGFAELFFGLDWRGIDRFPTAISMEEQQARREDLLGGRRFEFECMYTIEVRTEPGEVRRQLADLGEPGRQFLNPRWVSIQRISGQPMQAGTVIQYEIFRRLISFTIEQQDSGDPNLLEYRVNGGFANGGTFLFQITPIAEKCCKLTVCLAFDYPRGTGFATMVLWRTFKHLFPEYIHDVLWNQALCEIKQLAEAVDLGAKPELLDLKQV